MSNSTEAQVTVPAPVLQAVLDLTSNLRLIPALQILVDQACILTSSQWGIVTLLDKWGSVERLIFHGEGASRLATSEIIAQLMPQIPLKDPLLINDFTDPDLDLDFFDTKAPAFPIHNCTGLSVSINEQVLARLFIANSSHLLNKDDIYVLQALCRAAGIAADNSSHYESSRNRERWITATQKLITAMLEGADEDQALELIAHTVREVSDADTALIVLPSVGNTYAAEITEGYKARELLGVVFPPEGRAMSVLREGTGLIVDSMARAHVMRIPELKEFGPALYAPLIARGKPTGILILLRRTTGSLFYPSDLPLAESLASQAALALELASAQHAQDIAGLLDERSRIGRDLHDFAIQQLFATGMRLDNAKSRFTTGGLSTKETITAFDDSLASVDEAVRQIRAIVHDLRQPDRDVGLVERVRRETSLSRSFLGFAPSLVVSLDDVPLTADEKSETTEGELITRIESIIDASLADDIVAVVREGLSNIARHAHATAGRVSLEVWLPTTDDSAKVSVRVADDGRGIDPHRTRNSGLSNLRERARRHVGSFIFGSGIDGVGAEIIWSAEINQMNSN